MRLRQQPKPDDGAPADGARPDPANRLRGLRDDARALLAAGDEAIDRVISGDSEAFNSAVRQQGGQ